VTRCPSDLELEALLRQPDGGAAHLFECPRCAARVAEMRRLGEEFEREVFPATVEAVVNGAVRPRAARRALWMVPLAAAAAAAAVFLVVHPRGPPDGYLGSKGPPLTLVAYAPAPGGARALADGQGVPADAGLRFEVRPARPCQLWIVSADAAGHVSRIYPPSGEDGAKVQAGRPVVVPGGTKLDGRGGPERFFAICGCGDEPIRYPDVLRAAGAIGPGEARVRTARALPDLPADALQATLLVEKRP
jgi:hypothetical protein